MEIWKAIDGYERYQVSSYGRVRSIDREYVDKMGRRYHKKGQLLALQYSPDKTGYMQVFVSLCTENKMHRLLVHRLVAKAFIPNTDNLPQVNHIDEDSTNNHVENLEWCTARYNVNYGNSIKRRSISRSRKINVFDKHHNYIETVDSGVLASQKYNVSRSAISTSCHKHHKIKGYYFELCV